MARCYFIACRRFYRRSLLKLSPDERVALAVAGTVVVRRPLDWPLLDRKPDFAAAQVDAGGADPWGPGPYLKVPNRALDSDEEPAVSNRIFCPWGYPPDRVRLAHRSTYLRLRCVELVRDDIDHWTWHLTVENYTAETPGERLPAPCHEPL